MPSKKKIKRKRRSRASKGVCFIISPFGGWFDDYYDDIYKAAVTAAGLTPHRADDLYRPSAIVQDIWNYVKQSRVLLADLTGKNPNVFYELGLAHAMGKPVVLLTQKIEDVPFDLRALRVIEYEVQDPSWSEVLRVKIQKSLTEVLSSPEISVLPAFMQPSSRSSDRKSTPKSAVERKVLELQRTVNLLEAERSVTRERYQRAGRRLPPDEAEFMIRSSLAMKVPDHIIMEELRSRGVPFGWAQRRLRYLKARTRTKRKAKE